MNLSEETKKLFNAPWFILVNNQEKCYDVYNNINDRIASNFEDVEDAKRYRHLPELYETLMEAKNELYIMLNEWALGKSASDYLESYQNRKGRKNYEFFNEIQELLNKVREGK